MIYVGRTVVALFTVICMGILTVIHLIILFKMPIDFNLKDIIKEAIEYIKHG